MPSNDWFEFEFLSRDDQHELARANRHAPLLCDVYLCVGASDESAVSHSRVVTRRLQTRFTEIFDNQIAALDCRFNVGVSHHHGIPPSASVLLALACSFLF